MKKHSLEEAIKGKVSSLLEKTMEKSWGIAIPKVESDITDRLKNPQLNIYLPPNMQFQEAKKIFQQEFLKNELRLHRGNVSQMAKLLGLDRRSIHRAVKGLDLDIKALRSQEHSGESAEKYQENLVTQTIRSTLQEYEKLIQPHKMEKIYEEVPALSRNIAQILPHQQLTWKEAEDEFERQFILEALNENNWNIARTAKAINIRVETLHRKIKKLELRKEN